LPESLLLFERTVELDPQFARGWEGVAAVASIMRSWGYFDRDFREIARSAAERAIELDDTLSTPWAALGQVKTEILPVDWAAVLVLYDRAIAADEHNGTAWLWRSIAWVNLGFFERALADQNRCLALDAGYQNCRRWKALTLLYAGDTDGAIDLYAQGGAAGFVSNRADSFVGPLLRRGERVGAVLLLKELGLTPEQNDAVLDLLSKPTGQHSALSEEVVRTALGDRDSAFAKRVGESRVRLWLGEFDQIPAASDLDTNSLVQWEPGYPAFRQSPAFESALEHLGIPAYWREHGYPPQCRAIGQRDFTCD
jgi:tetratricopeptide (TPR) repeat protein